MLFALWGGETRQTSIPGSIVPFLSSNVFLPVTGIFNKQVEPLSSIKLRLSPQQSFQRAGLFFLDLIHDLCLFLIDDLLDLLLFLPHLLFHLLLRTLRRRSSSVPGSGAPGAESDRRDCGLSYRAIQPDLEGHSSSAVAGDKTYTAQHTGKAGKSGALRLVQDRSL